VCFCVSIQLMLHNFNKRSFVFLQKAVCKQLISRETESVYHRPELFARFPPEDRCSDSAQSTCATGSEAPSGGDISNHRQFCMQLRPGCRPEVSRLTARRQQGAVARYIHCAVSHASRPQAGDAQFVIWITSRPAELRRFKRFARLPSCREGDNDNGKL